MPIIGQPALSPALELVQIKRDLAAYNAAMSGEFDKEIQKLEDLLAEVQKANAPKELMKQVEAKMAEAEAKAAEVEDAIKKYRDEVAYDQAGAETRQKAADEFSGKLAKRERAIDEREVEAATRESAIAAESATLKKRANDLQAVRIAAEAELSALRLDLQKREQDVANREAVVRDKFEKMRTLAVA